MSVLFIGKRFYTNRDALLERYGRIWQLPWHWSQAGIPVRLWLVDYHAARAQRERHGMLDVLSTPVRNLSVFGQWMRESRRSNRNVEVVVASGDCYIGLMAYQLARRLRARFVFDVYDKYDEFGGYRRLPGFEPFEFLLRGADVRLFASRALQNDLAQAAGLECLVPNGVDLQRFAPHDLQESRRACGLVTNAALIGYFGGMEPDRGVADLIEAVQLARAGGVDVELLLGGKMVSSLDIHRPGVRHLGDIPYDRMPTMLACCDLLAVPYRRSAFMDAGASNKIAEAIACGRPLVATRTPNLVANFPAQAAQLSDVLATPGDPTDLARAMCAQLRQRKLVDLPAGMSWREIAHDTAGKLSLSTSVGNTIQEAAQ